MSKKDSLNPKDLLEGLYGILKNNGERLDEKAVSKSQQKFMGMVHAAQKGEKAASPQVAKVAKSMGKKDAKDFAKTKHKGLPENIKKEDTIEDESLKMFDRHSVGKRSGPGQVDNPWNHLHKKGRSFKGRTRKGVREECGGVGIVDNQNSTHDVGPDTLQKNLNAFSLEEAFDYMYEDMLNEAGVHKLDKAAKSSIRGAVTTPEANNNAGDAYKSYRFGLALAGAPDYPTKATNEIGGDPLLTTYTDEEWNMVQYAAKQSDVGPLKRLSSNRSKERDDTHTQSAISPAKKNRYGI